MKLKSPNLHFLRMAIDLARKGMKEGQGGPFGAVVVKDGEVIGQSCNQVTSTNDPTAHAEVQAIRNACQHLDHFQLTGCDLYTSCEPCPMCLGAIYWARPGHVFYAAYHSDAAEVSFDDQFIYEEIRKKDVERSIPMQQFLRKEAVEVFKEWQAMEDKTLY